MGENNLRSLCLQMSNIPTRRCPKSLRFLLFDSEAAGEPISQAKPHVAWKKSVAKLLGTTAKPQLREIGTTQCT